MHRRDMVWTQGSELLFIHTKWSVLWSKKFLSIAKVFQNRVLFQNIVFHSRVFTVQSILQFVQNLWNIALKKSKADSWDWIDTLNLNFGRFLVNVSSLFRWLVVIQFSFTVHFLCLYFLPYHFGTEPHFHKWFGQTKTWCQTKIVIIALVVWLITMLQKPCRLGKTTYLTSLTFLESANIKSVFLFKTKIHAKLFGKQNLQFLPHWNQWGRKCRLYKQLVYILG